MGAPFELGRKGFDNGVYIVIPKLPGDVSREYRNELLGEVVLRFLDQPILQESRSAQYETESLLHAPEAFSAYSSTEQREWTIEGKFFCRNEKDAEYNNSIIHVVRSLVMPDYNKSGSPPTPVKLYAYGNKHIAGVPCHVKSYSFDFPNDVDYITTGGITIPVVFSISLSLSEQHSVKQLRKFSLASFRSGQMVGF